MEFVYGNIIEEVPDNDIIFFTANSFVRDDGSMQMGAGLLRHFAGIEPKSPKVFGDLINKQKQVDSGDRQFKFKKYGIVFDEELMSGLFQIQYHYKDDISLDLINYSAHLLRGFCIANSDTSVHVDFPYLGKNSLQKPIVNHIMKTVLSGLDIKVWKISRKFIEDTD